MNVAIAAGHQRTAQAALDILQSGGNAIDAAIAALAMTWVAEPCLASAGGGGFAMVRTAGGDAKVFDFFCQTPCRKRPLSEVDFFPVVVNFGDAQETFHVGNGSTAIPGAIAGAFALYEHGATLPMRELLQPAIQAAKEGVVVNDFQRFSFRLLEPILRLSERGRRIYFQSDELIAEGAVLKLSQLADFLDYLWREGKDAFYQGEIAHKIARHYQENGGLLSLEDLENYNANIRVPQHFTYRDYTILTTPEPSIGGMIVQLALGRLGEQSDFSNHKSAAYVKTWHEILSTLNKIGREPERLRSALQMWQQQTWGSTTHFSIADRRGNVVSLTTSNGEGNGYFVEGTDIQMNNMLGESALLPRGFHSWQPDTRLNSMMTPTIVLDEHLQPFAALGTGGASRIPFVLAQVLHLLLDHKLPLVEAIEAARLHLEKETFHIEAGFEDLPPADSLLETAKYWQNRSLFFGGVHAIQKTGKSWQALGDARRAGAAVLHI